MAVETMRTSCSTFSKEKYQIECFRLVLVRQQKQVIVLGSDPATGAWAEHCPCRIVLIAQWDKGSKT